MNVNKIIDWDHQFEQNTEALAELMVAQALNNVEADIYKDEDGEFTDEAEDLYCEYIKTIRGWLNNKQRPWNNEPAVTNTYGFEPIDKHKQAILWTALERYWALPPNSLWSLEKGINRESWRSDIMNVEINEIEVTVRISGGFGNMEDWHDFMTGWQFQWLAFSLGKTRRDVPVPEGYERIDRGDVQIWSEDNGDAVLIFSIDTWTGSGHDYWDLFIRDGCYPPLIHGYGGE